MIPISYNTFFFLLCNEEKIMYSLQEYSYFYEQACYEYKFNICMYVYMKIFKNISYDILHTRRIFIERCKSYAVLYCMYMRLSLISCLL